ncbi:hypothetical protein CVT25_014750 [Psilocybe cyanescens]|uniref:Uncharacterized protein n=1 Tax=Psilocybe cyanescens TaxID=93625 RepID=A0A409X5C6_PSICY|nr:hypothetical protein CVT25_014750 [Psilocybe cyanescens]
MSTTDVTIPVNVQEGIIGANLNSSTLLNVLMVAEKTSYSTNHRIVLSPMSLLYLLCFSEFIVQWYFLNWVIVSNGDTRESIFLETVGGGPPWIFTSLASSHTAANIIYCPPSLQVQLDLQSGILHAEEKDYNTTY